MRWPCLILALLPLLPGCFRTESRSQTVISGSYDGKPLLLRARTDGSSDAGVDMAAVVQAVSAGLRGDIQGILSSVAPQKPPERDWTNEIALGVAGLSTTAIAVRQAMAHKRDSDEAWDVIKKQATEPTA